MKKSILLASLLAAAAFATSAQAQDRPTPPPGAQGPAKFAPGAMPPGQPPMKPIARDEALRRAAEQFDAADANKDGTLTPDEMRAAWEKRMGERMRKPETAGGPPGGPAGGPGQPPAKR